MTITCCKDCTEETGRYPGCGAHCDEYKAEKKRREEYKKAHRGENLFSIIPKRDRKIPQK